MVRVSFTPNIARHLDATTIDASGSTVREVLEVAFDERPRLRGYILDDQGRLRAHVNIFVSGQMLQDRDRQSDPVEEQTELWIFQALSGG